jgi:hypothetical protein
VISSRVAYDWGVPNFSENGWGSVTHYDGSPGPNLVGITAAGHRQGAQPAVYDRVAFTFLGTAFPSYEFRWAARSELTRADGRVVQISGEDVLLIVFLHASIDPAAPRRASVAGMADVVEYAVADTEEPNFSVGLGVHREIYESNPQTGVRAVEVRAVVRGQEQWVVAFDVGPN